MSEKKADRKIFNHKQEEVSEEFMVLHEELCDLYRSMESTSLGWGGHKECVQNFGEILL
jgi:hypothetical protein